MPRDDSSLRLSSLMVTWRQRPSSGGGRIGRELGPLPRQVVVVQDGRASCQDTGHHLPCRRIERQRAEVFDYHQISAGQCIAERTAVGAVDCADTETRDGHIDGPISGHRVRIEIEDFEGVLPLGGLDGHSVGAAQTEREECGGRDASTVAPRHYRNCCARLSPPGYRRGVPDTETPAAPSNGPSTSEDLLAVRAGPVLTLTINRPERRNAMTWDVIAGLRRELALAKVDPDVRVVVLAGAGDQAFCAGADLSGMVPADPGGTSDGYLDHHLARGWLAELFEEMWQLGKPTIARVQGWAMAGGFGLALACDMVIASDDAKFGAPELNVGLWPYMVTVSLLRSMPPKKALELMLTSRVVGAEEADRIGFVTRVVPADQLDTAVADLAAVLASKPPGVTKLGRDSFYNVIDSAASEALPYLHAMLTVTSQTAEAREGIAAFAEKRPPSWQVAPETDVSA